MGKKVGIKEAAAITGMSINFYYVGSRAGTIPHIKAGNRYIFDIELLEDFLRKEALKNVRQEPQAEPTKYGQLRRISL